MCSGDQVKVCIIQGGIPLTNSRVTLSGGSGHYSGIAKFTYMINHYFRHNSFQNSSVTEKYTSSVDLAQILIPSHKVTCFVEYSKVSMSPDDLFVLRTWQPYPCPVRYTVWSRGADNIALNIQNDVAGMTSSTLYKPQPGLGGRSLGPNCQVNCQL